MNTLLQRICSMKIKRKVQVGKFKLPKMSKDQPICLKYRDISESGS